MSSVSSVFIRRGSLEAGTVGESFVEMKSETLQAEEYQLLQQSTRSQVGAWNMLFSTVVRKSQPCCHLDLEFLAFRTMKKEIMLFNPVNL